MHRKNNEKNTCKRTHTHRIDEISDSAGLVHSPGLIRLISVIIMVTATGARKLPINTGRHAIMKTKSQAMKSKDMQGRS